VALWCPLLYLHVVCMYLYSGFIGPAVCLVATGYIECSKAGAVTMIVIAVGLSGVSMAGWAVNHLDLAPPYAGISSDVFFAQKIQIYSGT